MPTRDINRNPAYGVKKYNPDGSLNQEWFKTNGKYVPSNNNTRKKSYQERGRNPNIIQPSIRPEGTEGSEWDDYAWTADDL